MNRQRALKSSLALALLVGTLAVPVSTAASTPERSARLSALAVSRPAAPVARQPLVLRPAASLSVNPTGISLQRSASGLVNKPQVFT
ncbi:MAG: hypothetical protein RMM31_07050, partial [Anaerolineae bacterium]|nr:hypothetical protein [Anaerolineae bacterium]